MSDRRSPREIAERAAADLYIEDVESDYDATAYRVAEFLREFVLIVAPRLHFLHGDNDEA